MNGIRWWTGSTVLGLALLVNQFPCVGADKDDAGKDTGKDKGKTSATNNNDRDAKPLAFIGVWVEELHPAFASHLPGTGAKGQGLMVEDVGKDTPGSKAGLKNHDILMSYDDQKLFTPEQFVKLIHSDKPGREVSLGLIREGKSQTVKVTLGEREAKWDQNQFGQQSPHGHQFGFGGPGGHHQGQHSQQTQSDSDNPTWSSFDSLVLKKLDKDRFHASVSFTDKDGKMKKHEFEGTRDEIRKKIEADKELMPIERFHLERGLDLDDGNIPIFFLPEDPGFDF